MVGEREGSTVDRNQERLGMPAGLGEGKELQGLGIWSVSKDRQVQRDVPKRPQMSCPKRLLILVLMIRMLCESGPCKLG